MEIEFVQKKSKNFKIVVIVLIILIILCVYLILNNRKPIEKEVYEYFDVIVDPIQEYIESPNIFRIEIDDEYSCVIRPIATYRMTVKVKGISTLNLTDSEWRKKLSKYDLGVVWGKLADEYYDQFISYSQINRFLTWTYSNDINLTREYISSHVSNNHIVPANDNILKGIASLKEDDICYIEGKLIDLDIIKDNNIVSTIKTSLNRTDLGDGACESIYVEKIILGDEVYE